MGTFEAAIAFVIDQEDPSGKVMNDPNDPGGLTKWGIASRENPGVNVAALTRDGAIAIYRAKYWSPEMQAAPPALALALLDCAVNQGPHAAHILATAARGDLDMLLALRIRRYAQEHTWDTFGLGWSRRVLACHRKALELEASPPAGSPQEARA